MISTPHFRIFSKCGEILRADSFLQKNFAEFIPLREIILLYIIKKIKGKL